MRMAKYALATTLLAAFATHVTNAETYIFVPPVGIWDDPNNWTGGPAGTTPGADDLVLITGDQILKVEAADQAARTIGIGHGPEDVSALRVIGRTLTVGQDSTEQEIVIVDTGRMQLEPGAGGANARLAVRGTLTIRGSRPPLSTLRATFQCADGSVIEPHDGVPGSATLRFQDSLDVDPGTMAVTTNLEMAGESIIRVQQGAQLDIGAPQPGPNVPYFRGESSSIIEVNNGKVTFQVVKIGTSAEADASLWYVNPWWPGWNAELRVGANADTVSRNGNVTLKSPFQSSKLFFDSNHTTNGDLFLIAGEIHVAAGKTAQFGID